MARLLTTGQLARLFDLPKHTIRHYIDEGLLIPTINESNGYQQFGERDVYKLYQVLVLRKIGFSIENIKEMLREDTVLPSMNQAVVELEKQINELKEIQSTVEKIMDENNEMTLDEMVFIQKEQRYLKEVPSEIFKGDEIDLLSVRELGFEQVDILYFIMNIADKERIYTAGTSKSYDKVLEKQTYACKTVEYVSEKQLEEEIELIMSDPLFEMSSEKEIICYENLYRSLGYREKIFYTIEIAL